MLERAASKAADFTAFDHPGVLLPSSVKFKFSKAEGEERGASGAHELPEVGV